MYCVSLVTVARHSFSVVLEHPIQVGFWFPLLKEREEKVFFSGHGYFQGRDWPFSSAWFSHSWTSKKVCLNYIRILQGLFGLNESLQLHRFIVAFGVVHCLSHFPVSFLQNRFSFEGCFRCAVLMAFSFPMHFGKCTWMLGQECCGLKKKINYFYFYLWNLLQFERG